MKLFEAVSYLMRFGARDYSSDEVERVRACLERHKSDAVSANNQELAKRIWCFETILKVQQSFVDAFWKMKASEFYPAWCTLERVEVALHHLELHHQISDELDIFGLAYINTHVSRFQSLFPYRLFLSPGMIYLEKRCTICGAVVKPRNKCGHIVGEIYDGEMCGREITEVRLLEISLVTEPAQKYSVLFLVDPKTGEKLDRFDYSLVKYVIDGLLNPFHSWEVSFTKLRHPHSCFPHVSENDLCPCESGRTYEKCCLHESGVLRPHAQIEFSVAPPETTPEIVYPLYRA